MFHKSRVGLRMLGSLVCGALLLLCVSKAVGDLKPLSKEEQAKIDSAIDKGVAYLKEDQLKEGDWGHRLYFNRYLVGQCALPAYALLESGVPANDPVIQKAAEYVRARLPLTVYTYELSLAILFLDRLGDPKDKKWIQACALRLIAGQHRTGGWFYSCPILNDKNAQDLLNCLVKLNKARKDGERTRSQALQGLEIPTVLQELTVFQSSDVLSWREPPMGTGGLSGMTDNSNTQFALLALWVALRHDVSAEPALEIAVERFERFHIFPEGIWMYYINNDPSRQYKPSKITNMSMTCVGLIGLGIGRALKLPTPGSPDKREKDIHVLRGLAALSRGIGKPNGDMNKRAPVKELYFLWSLERVAMLYDLTLIGNKEWYRWGAECLITNQKNNGSFQGRVNAMLQEDYGAALNTSFALLFLKRSHPMKDLTPKLPFKGKDLNEGIARLRPRDNYPVRTTATPLDSKPSESLSKTLKP